MKQIEPGLFGQNHNNSSRNYSQEYYWGKNQFNSSFPASLVAYMSFKGVKPV
ncbi:MAG: HindVP family restriction endonuclease, partial [Muribaculaceae bacterium]|nr:HindVP family restriction endonuclease [Muribaculaceae bacterium]